MASGLFVGGVWSGFGNGSASTVEGTGEGVEVARLEPGVEEHLEDGDGEEGGSGRD